MSIAYKFGVWGSGGATGRSGGVLGYDFGVIGGLGYYSNGLIDYSVYGFGTAFTTGVAAGMLPELSEQSVYNKPILGVGLGMYGGVMGGWIKGLVYGTYVNGKRYGLYVDGNTFVNRPVIQLNSTEDGNKIPSYSVTSSGSDFILHGQGQLNNGIANVNFDAQWAALISADKPVLVTITPTEESNGVFVSKSSREGFAVKENNGGHSNASFTWIAVVAKLGNNPEISPELLTKDYEYNMQGVMHNDNDTETAGTPIWYDGKDVKFDSGSAEYRMKAVLEHQQAMKALQAPASVNGSKK